MDAWVLVWLLALEVFQKCRLSPTASDAKRVLVCEASYLTSCGHYVLRYVLGQEAQRYEVEAAGLQVDGTVLIPADAGSWR